MNEYKNETNHLIHHDHHHHHHHNHYHHNQQQQLKSSTFGLLYFEGKEPLLSLEQSISRWPERFI